MRIVVETQGKVRARGRRRFRARMRRVLRTLAGLPVREPCESVTFRRISRIGAAARRVVPDPIRENRRARSMTLGLVAGVLHVAFAIANVVAGLVMRSVWTLSVGLVIAGLNAGKSYLASGALMGGALERRGESRESLKRCRRAGIALMLLVLIMSGTVTRIVVQGFGGVYAGAFMYGYAVYALIQIFISLVNVVRARREDMVAIKGVRAFNVACALMSVFALQTVVLARVRWAELPLPVTREVAEAAVGGAVCATLVAIGFWLARAAGRALDERRRGVRGCRSARIDS